MKICAVIRSVGERTEELCYESLMEGVQPEDVAVLKNKYPPYRTYMETFSAFSSFSCDWCLAIDADVILKKGWRDVFERIIFENDVSVSYAVHFQLLDCITKNPLFRGVHFYNPTFLRLAALFIECNSIIFHSEQLRSVVNHRFYTKIESSLVLYFQALGVRHLPIPELIGWHGFEQFYSEIFRQYAVRTLRDPEFIYTHTDIFNKIKNKIPLDDELFSAKLGHQYYNIIMHAQSIEDIKSKISDKLKENNIVEKGNIDFSLVDFRDKYEMYLIKNNS